MRALLNNYFAVLFIGLSTFVSSTAWAQLLDLELKTISKRITITCELLEIFEAEQTDLQKSLDALRNRFEDHDAEVMEFVLSESGSLNEQGRLSGADFSAILSRSLTSHSDPLVQKLIDTLTARDQIRKIFDQREADIHKDLAASGAKVKEMRADKSELEKKYAQLLEDLEDSDIITGSEEEKRAKKRLEDLNELLNWLAFQISEREKDQALLDGKFADQADDTSRLRSLTDSYGSSDFILSDLGVEPSVRSQDRNVTIETRFITESDPFFEHIGLSFGATNEPDLVFQNFGQELNTHHNWFASIEAAFRGPKFGQSPWKGYWTANYTYIQMEQGTHRNIIGGVPGPSNGTVSFGYLGGGLAAARPFEFGSLGFGLGFGALFHDVSGSFRASGVTPAVRLDAFTTFPLTSRIDAGPFFSTILPMDDVSGGAGLANSRYQVDPIFMFGVKFHFRPHKY